MIQKLFITSISANSGKTYLIYNILRAFANNNLNSVAIKPVTSKTISSKYADSLLYLKCLGLTNPTAENIAAVSPYNYIANEYFYSPKSDNISLFSLSDVSTFCNNILKEKANENVDLLLIEGLDGLMSPLNASATNLDLIASLQYKTLLVVNSYIGSISHTLSAIKVLESIGCDFEVIFNYSHPEENILVKNDIALNILKTFFKGKIYRNIEEYTAEILQQFKVK